MTVVIPTGARVIDIDLDTIETNVFKNVPYETHEQFYSTDIGMAFLKFTGVAQDYTGCTARLSLINFNDGSKVQRIFEMDTTTTFVYPMLETELVHAGRWIGQLTVIKGGTTISDNPFRFKINGPIMNTALISFDNVNTFTDQLTVIYDGLNTFLDSAILQESDRVAAESLRVAAEGLRVTADALRETKEGIRQTTFEANEVIRDGIVNSLVTAETVAQKVAEKYQLIEAESANRLLSVEQQLAENDTYLTAIKNNPNNYTGPIITFIDDDAKEQFRTVWQPVLDSKNIKIGIAVYKNYIGLGNNLTLAELLTLQSAGHDVLNHSYTHAEAFTTITPANAEIEVSSMRDYMVTNGLKGSDIFVYPGGMSTSRVEIKDVIRKYCKYALNSSTGQNLEPVDNWYMGRTFMDLLTLAQLKTEVDNAITNNKWLVFGSHSHLIVDNTPEKIGLLIDYIQGLGVPILPFTEAEKIKGNSIAIGEYSSDNSVFISQRGVKRIGLGGAVFNMITSNGNTMDDAISTYTKNSITVKNLILTADTLLGIGGVMTVYRMDDDSYSYADFKPNTQNKVYRRRWNTGTSAWYAWEDTIVSMVANPRQIFPLENTTPSVKGGNYFLFNGVTAITVTDFLDGVNGQIIYVGLNNINTTIQSNTRIKLKGGANFTGAKNDMIQLIYDGASWKEISRSNNVV